MELRHLRYFVMAAEEGNISRAAERLYVSQPAVSRQIKDLEDELGLRLFNRESSGLSLTEGGLSALAYAREILRQSYTMIDAMTALANRETTVPVKVGFLPTALPGFLTNAMRQFNRKYKNFCVQIFEMTPTQQAEALRSGEIDIALIGELCPDVKRDFNVDTIHRTEMAMIVPDDHPLAKRKSVELSEFSEDTFVSLDETHFPGRPQLMADMFSKAEINPSVAMRAKGLSELLGLVGGGAGVAMAPADLIQLPHSGVVFITLKKPKRAMPFWAAWQKTGDLPGVEALVALIKAG